MFGKHVFLTFLMNNRVKTNVQLMKMNGNLVKGIYLFSNRRTSLVLILLNSARLVISCIFLIQSIK